MIDRITIDFETYSEAGFKFDKIKNRWGSSESGRNKKRGLKLVGAPAYAEHPSTEVLSLSYDSIDKKDVIELWVPGMEPPFLLFDYIKSGGAIEAHNVEFELLIWHYVCHLRMGWPALSIEQSICSAAKSRFFSLPSALEKVSEVLGTVGKDPEGGVLLNKLSVPKNPTKTDSSLRRTTESHPDLFKKLYNYNIQDVIAEKQVSEMVPDLPPFERKIFNINTGINMRGVAIDTSGLSACSTVINLVTLKYTEKLRKITGVPGLTIDQLDTIKKWAYEKHGVVIDSLRKEKLEALIKNKNLPDDLKTVLNIRASLGSKSVQKLKSIKSRISSDNRLRGLFIYSGATNTQRFSGAGVQPQNLYGKGVQTSKCDYCGEIQSHKYNCYKCSSTKLSPVSWSHNITEIILEDIKTLDINFISRKWSDVVTTVASCLRSLFIAGEGKEFICSDYSAIEAVVLAEVSEEAWRQEVFRTHGKIYETSASRISGVPFEEFLEHKKTTGSHHPLRSKLGKVAELASGYQGWINAWKNFGAGEFMSDEEIKNNILAWRKESSNIVEFWGGQYRKHPYKWHFEWELHGVEGAAVSAIYDPGSIHSYKSITFFVDARGTLNCLLPSGGTLRYHNAALEAGTHYSKLPQYTITFYGYNSDSSKGAVGWCKHYTHGGKLTENIVQRLARDILVYAMYNLTCAGYDIVLDVHDEIIAEQTEGFSTVRDFERIMGIMPEWAKDWPIKASGGWIGKRFRKD